MFLFSLYVSFIESKRGIHCVVTCSFVKGYVSPSRCLFLLFLSLGFWWRITHIWFSSLNISCTLLTLSNIDSLQTTFNGRYSTVLSVIGDHVQQTTEWTKCRYCTSDKSFHGLTSIQVCYDRQKKRSSTNTVFHRRSHIGLCCCF